jgi:cytochrome c oxidase cbb3-type subunit 2/cytochrome c oxidase cbb3-type subunit I/II
MPVEFAAVLSGRGLRQAYAVASVAGLVFFAMSAVLLGVWPARVLAEETRLTAPAGGLTLSAAEARGRAVYAREGCGYCHTQQIRFTQADIARFGAPTMAWETRFDYPHLWGTRRIGPDLARAGGTRPADWHFVHLYAPRDIVSGSVMPAYPWLFEGSPAAPTQDGRDLVAYLETLGRARELAYPEGDAAALGAAPDRHMVRMAVEVAELNAHPGRARTGSDAPALTVPEAVSERGRDLWTQHCASCHGADGRGAGPAARWLRPAPTDLTTHDYAASRLADALWNGGAGTSMPAWRDLPADDRAALAAMMRSFAPPPDDTPVADDVVALGRQVFATHCAQCHGREGGGDGFAARQFPVAPTDFTRQRPTFEAAVTALTMGVAGTSMAPWGDRLNGAEIEAVARVLRLFYRPESSAGGGR